ncbi:MAG: AzlD domain-containing protein, partial [Gammaproteobacteria bacterium]|nr:AzlD domain-containing protein [Gammaproteobacteria bacterium]
MSEINYLWAVIAVMAFATFATRVLPFVALKNRGEHPVFLFLGRY